MNAQSGRATQSGAGTLTQQNHAGQIGPSSKAVEQSADALFGIADLRGRSKRCFWASPMLRASNRQSAVGGLPASLALVPPARPSARLFGVSGDSCKNQLRRQTGAPAPHVPALGQTFSSVAPFSDQRPYAPGGPQYPLRKIFRHFGPTPSTALNDFRTASSRSPRNRADHTASAMLGCNSVLGNA